MSGLVGAVLEAWDELRIHKLRVLLSLIGVAVAVAAITVVTAAVQILQEGYTESNDRSDGRAVTLTLQAYSMSSGTATRQELAAIDTAFAKAVKRYDISWASRNVWTSVSMKTPSGPRDLQVQAVDPAYGTIYRTDVTRGRWLDDADNKALAPALVVNQEFLDAQGITDLSSHPTVLLGRNHPVLASIVGVYTEPWRSGQPQAFAAYDPLSRWDLIDSGSGASPSVVMWVPNDLADGLSKRLRRDLSAAVPGLEVNVSDNRAGGSSTTLDGASRWVAFGVGAFALLLGGLGLVNISLTTVRYRIREIGIRRSFGATSSRVFFGVLMESVVATVVAGLVGVVIAVVVLKNVPTETLFGTGLQDRPAFPVTAALVGMAAATGVGALAGLMPALVAVRVKVIDAIRY